MRARFVRVGGTAALALLCLSIVPVRGDDNAPKMPEITQRSFTVLKITRYDGTITYEAIKSNEMRMRAREVWEEYPIREEAHQRAQVQWAKWFAEKKPENAGREWVLPKPKPPKFGSLGAFPDIFDAEDKARKLMSAEEGKMSRLKQQLRQNARYSKKAMAYLSNLEENRKLVEELIPEVHEALMAADRRVIAAMSDKKKKTVWNLAHIAQQKAERDLRKKTVDENKNPVEPDVVDLYNALQDAIAPILKRYDINERQWYMIWEDGYMDRWAVPKLEEEKQINIVAAEVDKEKAPEKAAPGEEKPEDKPKPASDSLKELEAATGLEDLGDVRLETPEKPEPEKKKQPKKSKKEKKEEEAPKTETPRGDWW